MKAFAEDEPRYFCLVCRDESASWREFWCPGFGPARNTTPPPHVTQPVESCGRMKHHGPHGCATRCDCYGTNPVSAARREREQRRLEAPKKPGRAA